MNNRNLVTGFGLALLILLITSIISYISIHTLLKSMDEVTASHRLIQDLEGIMSGLKDAETGQRGYLITDDVDFLEDYNGASERVMGMIASLQPALKTPDQKNS